MSNPRLYYGPEDTKKVLRLVIKGATTREELADELNCTKKTVYNKVHDPKYLGFLDKEDGEYVIDDKDRLMKLFQLDKREILKEPFKEMPGVEEVDDELDGGSLTYKRIGQLISYYTDSEAIDDDAFITYGRVYANWFEYLRMGYAVNRTLYRNRPANIELEPRKTGSGDKSPKVRPDKVFESLPVIRGGISGKSELASHFAFSEREAGKVLSTCYALNLAEREGLVTLTGFGEQVENAPEAKRRKLIRDALLDIELIETYCRIAPDTPFKNQELMTDVNEELGKNWNETTVQTKGKRIYQWLLYAELFKEIKQGTLVPTASADDYKATAGDGLSSISDYA